ncbi:DUF1343 domain-containing protein [Alkalimonas collagenimarina]|uniref:DUF1343 domain-containing protein n=1 Tax=Alkalimonas collagenimarina TaxID=400390 RepID=A0ABT9GZM8_9GAMM|nr:DUF1343 domain-containing protein [Alkalimonas collagenimarina]MDP4536319.1 DUF1343 domain-containing protein [Alkalimonas collagenimarina]
MVKPITCFVLILLLAACSPQPLQPDTQEEKSAELVLGVDQTERFLPLLAGKRVGLVVNQTSMHQQQHLVDYLISQQVTVQRIFAPEHGFRGDHDAGAHVKAGIDTATGVEIYSIYGSSRKPSEAAMHDLDVVLFDIQDVGARFYTYISSMHYVMEAASERGIPFIVLDRPNPNGEFVDGPLLDEAFRSFVGMHRIPLLHGMTVAELAQMILAEGWLDTSSSLELHVVPMLNYERTMRYELPVRPSPNLPNYQSIRAYASLCFFEATPVSEGRGTDFPFQVIGHPTLYVSDTEPAFSFTPRSIPGAASNPKFKDQTVYGQDLRHAPVEGLQLSYLINWYRVFAEAGETFFTSEGFMDRLAGTNTLRLAIEQGQSEEEIKASWQADLAEFKQRRTPYLLYP